MENVNKFIHLRSCFTIYHDCVFYLCDYMLRVRWNEPDEYILDASSDSVLMQERIHILPETQNGVFKGYVLHISCLEDGFVSELYLYHYQTSVWRF